MTGNYTSVILELGQVSTVAYLELLLPGAGPKFVVPLRPIMKYPPPPQKKGGGGGRPKQMLPSPKKEREACCPVRTAPSLLLRH